MPWLSVLIPVYNVRDYLHECLASVVDQLGDDRSVQILILDDCSTDGSWVLMQELAQRWPGRLQLLRHERNGGLSAARNTLIQAARGDYLWFLDSDDKLLPGAISGLRAIVHASAPDVVLCDFAVWRERPRLKHRLRGARHRHSFNGPSRRLVRGGCLLLAAMLSTGELHAWSKISRRALWRDDLRFPVGHYFEDMTTMPLMALRADSFYYEPVPWVAYRQRPGSIMAHPNLSKALDQSASLLPFAQALKASRCSTDARTQFSLARQAARNLVGAMRSICRSGALEAPSEAAEMVRRNFLDTSPLSPQALARAYLLRGWWLRRHRFLRWFNARP